MSRPALPSVFLTAMIVGAGCGSRALPANAVSDAGVDLLTFCSGPAKVAFGSGPATPAEGVEAHWTVISGPASPLGGGVGSRTRVWVRLIKYSTWDWVTESGVTVDEAVQAPVRVDLAHLPSAAWFAWTEHGLARTLPDEEKTFSGRRGHAFVGQLELRGSQLSGAEVSLCMAATRPDGSLIKVHAAGVPVTLAP